MFKTLASVAIGFSIATLTPMPVDAHELQETPVQLDAASDKRNSMIERVIADINVIQPVTAPEIKTDSEEHMLVIKVVPNPEPVVEPTPAPSSSTSRSSNGNSNNESASKPNADKPKTEPVKTAPSSGKGANVVETALMYVGTPYKSGGKTPAGFDCSGFTSYVYGQHGINLSSSSAAQRNAGTVVTNPEPGDIIWTPGHVGIYVGNGKQIDAPRPGKTVQVRGIWQSNPTYIRIG